MLARGWRLLGAGVAAVVDWRFFKPTVFLACLAPALLVAYELCQIFLWNQPGALGADPAKALLHETGQDALLILLVTLAVTPIRRLFSLNRIQRVRRMLGVWAFAFAVMHVSMYLVFQRLCYSWETCDLATIGDDIAKRRFILAGLMAFTILSLLAITSTGGWVRRLKKNWQRLHRLVYVAALAAVVHFIWIQKSDISEPMEWMYWLLGLLGFRVYLSVQKRRAARLATVTP
jgi:sulfoxide reductase heme-binding subunit YedZ